MWASLYPTGVDICVVLWIWSLGLHVYRHLRTKRFGRGLTRPPIQTSFRTVLFNSTGQWHRVSKPEVEMALTWSTVCKSCICARDDMVNHRVGVVGAHALTWSVSTLVGAHAYVAIFAAYLVLGAACCGGPCFYRSCTRGFQVLQIGLVTTIAPATWGSLAHTPSKRQLSRVKVRSSW